jgi:hypothetical protein
MPHSKIKAALGVKSQICAALGYKSDGHFHHDWNYLVEAGMLREKDDCFEVTEAGKKEFALQSTASTSNITLVAVGIVLITFTLLLEWKIAPIESTAVLGVVLIFMGALLSMLSRANKPQLPISAKVLIKELK